MLIRTKIFSFFQDETFPELGLGSVEGCDDQESVCSSNEREGDAFPKAFDRDLVTPTNLQKTQAAESVDGTAGAAANVSIDNSESDTKETKPTTECESFFKKYMYFVNIYVSGDNFSSWTNQPIY